MIEDKVRIPPIKIHGIKSKLVSWISENAQIAPDSTYIEPFMGSGVVGFNIAPRKAIFADINPYIISFYEQIQLGKITPELVREYLEHEGQMLEHYDAEYYKRVRDRFNAKHNILDFLFLNRACFNGMMRFNLAGEFNTPYNHKPFRFSKAYITKIANQVDWVHQRITANDWRFVCCDFRAVIELATSGDFIYCDPPYSGRHADYYNGWTTDNDVALHNCLMTSGAKFILSSWERSAYRANESLKTIWNDCNITTRDHFYFVGGKETNRNTIVEAIVANYELSKVM